MWVPVAVMAGLPANCYIILYFFFTLHSLYVMLLLVVNHYILRLYRTNIILHTCSCASHYRIHVFFCVFSRDKSSFADIQRHVALRRRSCRRCSSMRWSTKWMCRVTRPMIASSCQRWDHLLSDCHFTQITCQRVYVQKDFYNWQGQTKIRYEGLRHEL